MKIFELVSEDGAGATGVESSDTSLRLSICIVIGIVVVCSLIAFQQWTGTNSNAQIYGAGMIAVVLTWVLTGMRSRS
jgi:uncharacterized membrane protein (DUF485 family)